MLPAKGRTIKKKRRNLHIKREEFLLLMDYIKKKYAMRYYLVCMFLFGMGLRVGSAVAINLFDFRDNFTKLAYRDNKSDKIQVDPIPEDLQHLVKLFVKLHGHTCVGGWILPNTYIPSRGFVSSTAFQTWFCKVRQGIGEEHPEFLDGEFIETLDKNKKPTGKVKWCYRIGTHSFRRLHRTTFVREGAKVGISKNDIKFMCHYESWKAFEVYINEFEILENHKACVDLAINPLIRQVLTGHNEQTSLNAYP